LKQQQFAEKGSISAVRERIVPSPKITPKKSNKTIFVLQQIIITG
jgi:hypothetical protein